MQRWILAAALAATPCVARAQDWSYYIDNIATSTFEVTGDLYVRNEFAYDPNRFFSITAIILRGGGGQGGGGTVGSAGSFGTQTVGGFLGGQTYSFNSNYFGSITPSINQLVFGNPAGTSLTNGLGLIGCSVPLFGSNFTILGYAGSTCAEAGYTGYVKLAFRLGGYTLTAPPQPLTPSDFTVMAVGEYRDIPSIFVTPEPATNLLLAAGLFVLGLARVRTSSRKVARQ